MARIRFINSDGGGFSDMISIPDGQTVAEFLKAKQIDARKFTIRLNRQECVLENDVLKDDDRLSAVTVGANQVAGTQPLKEADRVSVTPKNIAGAELAALLENLYL